DRERGIYEASDHIAVLYESRMPAVLLEAGMIVNRAEEEVLSSPAFRATVAKTVAEAVERFFALRWLCPNPPPSRRKFELTRAMTPRLDDAGSAPPVRSPRRRGETRGWNDKTRRPDHSGFMPANLSTLAHLAISCAIMFLNSADEPPNVT